MKIDKNTKSLFWHNFIATTQIVFGANLLIISLVCIAFSKFLISFILMVVGGFFAFRGKIRRLDYERKSGYIIHEG